MEYIISTDGPVEILKTKAADHTNLSGYQQITQDLPEERITDHFWVVRKLKSAEDSAGACYDWYEINRHYRQTDRTPAIARRISQLPPAEEARAAVAFVRAILPTAALTGDQTIAAAALYDRWAPGAYRAGDIRLAEYEGSVQPWRCRQDHDTAVCPEIRPGGKDWRTFWIPYHGTTPETAQDWVAPTMAEDRYKAGEYMRKDGRLCSCRRDTSYGPEDDPDAWETSEIFREV